jgi:demethylmenaquinone methyltransferase/2-methoxy-6-polyprenyl-1,4-benzoquinol methylase
MHLIAPQLSPSTCQHHRELHVGAEVAGSFLEQPAASGNCEFRASARSCQQRIPLCYILHGMANKYYAAGEQRADRVNDLFATIAPRYDLINDLQSFGLHRLWKRRLVRVAQVSQGDHALDLCCGTGDVAFALARAGAKVIGLDFSEPMLDVARRRAAAGHSVRFLQGDALAVPFSENSFDAVTISYGLRNLSDWRAGLREMWRVARPGGRVLVLDFGKPASALWRRLYFAYLRACVPLLGRLFFRDAETHGYILESLQHYPAQQGVAAGMRELGFSESRVVELLGGVMSINVGIKAT